MRSKALKQFLLPFQVNESRDAHTETHTDVIKIKIVLFSFVLYFIYIHDTKWIEKTLILESIYT